MTTRTLDLADGDFGDLPDRLHLPLHLAADFSADDYDRALRVNAEGTGLRARALPQRQGGAGDVDGHRLQAAPRPVARVPRGRSARRRDGCRRRRRTRSRRSPRRRWRATAPARSTCRSPSPAWAPRTATRAGCRSGTSTRSRPASRCATRWDPMPYSPIHDDDICAQLEPLLDAASVPATIVNWGGDEPVSVQEWSAYFGELLGVEAEVVVERDPGRVASARSATTPSAARSPARARSAGGTGSAAWPSTSIPTGAGATDVTATAYPTADALLAEATRDDRSRRLRPRRLPRGPRRAAREPRARRRPRARRPTPRVVGDLRRRLVNRLEVEAWYRDHPEIDELAGARTGRHQRPAAHRHHRAGQHAVARSAVPLPARVGAGAAVPAADDRGRGRPIRGALQLARENEQLSPELKAMHLYDVDATMEDTELLGMAFHGQQYTLPVYGYHAWWRAADLTADVRVPPAGGEAAAVASARPTSGCSRRRTTTSTSKRSSPPIPDARFVMTHRDPGEGRCRPGRAWCRPIFPPPHGERDLHRLGREVSEHLRVGMEQRHRGTRAHRRGPLPRRAPPRARRRSDGHRARASTTSSASSSTPTVEQTISDWQDANRSGAHGHAPLHRRAVRPRADAQIRADYRLLHPTTSTSTVEGTLMTTHSTARCPAGPTRWRRSRASATTCSRRGAPTARPRPRSRT